MDAANLAEAIQRNEAATARIASIAGRVDESSRVVDGRWTVAAKLAHLAFWDRFVLRLLNRWEHGLPVRFDHPDWYDDTLNDAILDESLAVEASVAGRLALEAARAVDELLGGLSADDALHLEADAARPETDANWLVHRYRHREEHLDEIEAALGLR